MAIQPSSNEAGPSTHSGVYQADYALAQTLTGHSRGVTALRFTNDGRMLVSAGKRSFALSGHADVCPRR